MKLLAAAAALFAIASCGHTTSAGCLEYDPLFCSGGPKTCVIDAKGCNVCSCDSGHRDGELAPNYVRDPYSAPINRP